MKPLPVHIEWHDAAHIGPGEWVDPDGIAPRTRVVTVGLLIARRHGYHVIAASVQENGDCTGVFAIPNSGIDRVRVLAG